MTQPPEGLVAGPTKSAAQHARSSVLSEPPPSAAYGYVDALVALNRNLVDTLGVDSEGAKTQARTILGVISILKCL